MTVTSSVFHILYQVTVLPFLVAIASVYYSFVLLRLPSLPYFRLCAQQKVTISETTYPEDEPCPVFSTITDLWTRSCTLCKCILVISFIAQPFYTNIVMTIIAAATWSCCIFAIALSVYMRWHVGVIQKRPHVFANWLVLTSHRERSRFITTPMLLAAPVAWAVWASALASTLVCLIMWGSDGNTFAPFALDQLPAFFANIKFTHGSCNSTLSGSPAAGQRAPVLATLPVAALLVFGVAHVCFIMVAFSPLGYPVPWLGNDGACSTERPTRSTTVGCYTRENDMNSSGDGAGESSVSGPDSTDDGSLSPTGTFVDDDQISLTEYDYSTAVQSPV